MVEGMKYEQILPSILILIDVAAASVYLCKWNLWHFGYWMAAAVLTTCVTFGMKA